VLDFRVYYRNGVTWDGGDPSQAPAFGVLLIVERDPTHGRRIVSNGDYYIWKKDHNRWWPQDFIGLVDYLANDGWCKVIFGAQVPNEEWNETFRRAMNDPDFPAKTGHDRFEIKGELKRG
jgi:hypothetical protein